MQNNDVPVVPICAVESASPIRPAQGGRKPQPISTEQTSNIINEINRVYMHCDPDKEDDPCIPASRKPLGLNAD